MEQQLIKFGSIWSDSIVKAADALPGCTERDITSLLSIKEGCPTSISSPRSTSSSQLESASLTARKMRQEE